MTHRVSVSSGLAMSPVWTGDADAVAFLTAPITVWFQWGSSRVTGPELG